MDKTLGYHLTRLGFNVPQLSFSLRTALASGLAMLLAWWIGLEHPQWSAMTVWAVSQPVRGMLLEKSLFRALGTLLGTLFGVLLVLLTGDNLPYMVVSLALWIGLCVGVGNLLSGLVSYGTLLSGYSAAMVVLLNTQQPEGQIFLLGIDRLLTVLTGVLVGLLVGLLFTPRDAEDQLASRVRRSSSDILRAMAEAFTDSRNQPRAEITHRLLQDIAATEQLFDTHAAGSPRSHRSVKALRALVQAQVAATFWIRNSRNLAAAPAMAEALKTAARALDNNAPASQVVDALTACRERSTDQSTLTVLSQLLDCQRTHLATEGEHSAMGITHSRVVLHRDWIGARHASLRALTLLLLIAALWIVTGFQAGAYVMLGASVMISLFSTFETPSRIMGHIFIWQSIAAAAALTCYWLVWPWASNEWQMIALLLPFILLIVPFMAHPRVNSGSMDYMMALLLLSHPVYPLDRSFAESVTIALAVVSGPLLAYIAFRLLWPADTRRRRQHLTGMMLNELVNMARSPFAPERQQIWRTRLQHRLLKLIQSVNRSDEPLQPVTQGALAVLAVGNAIQQLHELQRQPQQPLRLQRQIRVALLRLRQIRQHPAAAARSLRRTADQLQQHNHPAAWTLENAARAINANQAFFKDQMGSDQSI